MKCLATKAISLDSLAGERREITVYFADIRGFTELTDAAQARRHGICAPPRAERRNWPRIISTSRRGRSCERSAFTSAPSPTASRNTSGTLDKYIGDCVMAFWGAPLPNPHHALAAVRCAIEAQQALHALNVQREEENKRREQENFERLRAGSPLLPRLPVLSMGSGINTGMAIAGFMGSEPHIVNYTVFGREVNLASRLEGVSGHGRIIIGEGTYAALQRDDPALAKTCFELPPAPVKGFRERVRISRCRGACLPPPPNSRATRPES